MAKTCKISTKLYRTTYILLLWQPDINLNFAKKIIKSNENCWDKPEQRKMTCRHEQTS